MGNFGLRVREYLRESAERKLRIGRMTVSRLAILGVGAGILVAAVAGLLYFLYGNRSKGISYARADVASGYQYRIKDDIVTYRADNRLYTYDGARNKSTYYAVEGIEGYDTSASMTVVYSGSNFQIQGMDQYRTISNGVILDVRAGTNCAALLFKTPGADRNERFILVINREMESICTLPFIDSEIVAFDFLSTGSTELLWVSTMDVGQFTEESIVRIYDCGQNGAMIHYSAAFYNQSIYDAYLSDRCLFLIGTQTIVRYDRDEDGGFSAERDRVRVYGSTIVDFAAGSETAYFIALPDAAEGERNSLVRLITVSQTDDLWSNVMQKYMPSPIVGAFLHGGSICVFTDGIFLQYSYAGKELKNIELSDRPVDVLEYGETGFLMITEQNSYRVTLD
ncbi:MAG: hypothetical protein IJJ86_07120 [Clostridia bacterium]|nr:hypothetical protein [Clostridia bacterium]